MLQIPGAQPEDWDPGMYRLLINLCTASGNALLRSLRQMLDLTAAGQPPTTISCVSNETVFV